jgi:hypothetical protein
LNGATKPKAGHSIASKIITFAVVVGVAAGGFLYGPVAFDAYRASTFTPPAAVESVESSIKLTPAALRTFRATKPAIEDSDRFNSHCKSTERTAAILGCYYGDRIYLFDVKNPELAGAKEVTAAHELLHAQYARLNIFERPRVDAMIKKAYQKVKNEPEIAKAIEYYREAEPGAEIDELHSIIGTTIANLDSDLEQYYARYFTERASIVAKNQAYTAVFDRVNTQAKALQSKLQTTSAQIKQDIETYQADLSQLNADIASFNERAGGGEFSSQADFAVARSALQRRISAINARQRSLNARISAYNNDVAELKNLAVKADQLNQSINGVAAPTGVNSGQSAQ